MYKLLNAGLVRVKNNKLFWSLIIITLLIASITLLNQYKEIVHSRETGFPIDHTEELLVDFIKIIGFFIAVFTSLFVGTEYANGTIRNKIVIGHSRTSIYLSNLIISIVVGLLIELIYMLVVSTIAIPMFGKMQIPLSQFAFIIVDIIMIIIAYSSLFNLIGMICTDVTVSTVISILLTLVMLIGFLNIPSENNTIFNIVPARQAILITDCLRTMEMPEEFKVNVNFEILSLYSLVFIVLINIIGLYCFNRKYLK